MQESACAWDRQATTITKKTCALQSAYILLGFRAHLQVLLGFKTYLQVLQGRHGACEEVCCEGASAGCVGSLHKLGGVGRVHGLLLQTGVHNEGWTGGSLRGKGADRAACQAAVPW